MEKILGNFLTQPNKDFPLDAETLDYLQNLTSIPAIVGNIAGDKVVLCGCESTNDGVERKPGWVFVKTKGFPDGEILYWEGGSTTSGMYIKQEQVSVTANNVEYTEAYTKRWLAPGYGNDENFRWEEFTEIKTIKELLRENSELRTEIAGLQPPPVGIIQMWAGTNVPDGYLLCDGLDYEQSVYPKLYEVLGTTFNNAIDAKGEPYITAAGRFRVPDLCGRFVVGQYNGQHNCDEDYKKMGIGGGEKTITLTEEQLPTHSHSFKDFYHAEGKQTSKNCNREEIVTNGKIGCGDSDYGNDHLIYYEHDTKEAGKGESFDNRPPYYVLAYIIRAK